MAEVGHERLQKWFEDHFDGNACIMCTRLGVLQLGYGHSIPVMPLRKSVWYISVECSICGHALFFNAETIGVLKPST